jgi:medium-chain acyl-[acyl-carrier-protein] hydrolase
MEQIVSSLLPAIEEFAIGPYAILGASMGAWVGYEICLRLATSNLRQPEALIVCGSSSPYDKEEEYRFANLRGAELLAELGGLNPALTGTPESSELVEMMLPILEADFAACEAWRPDLSAKLTLPVFAFYGDKDTFVARSEMEKWRFTTDHRFQLDDVPGTHFFVDDPPDSMFVRLAEILRDLPGAMIH